MPGEELDGCAAARQFVAWYNGHPDAGALRFDLSQPRVVVIGQGNVALDVARILTRDTEELARTDIADHALAALRASRVREVMVVGRRGPLQAAFNDPELEELGEVAGADVIVDPSDLPSLDQASADGADTTALRKLKLPHDYAARGGGRPDSRRIVLHFLQSPAAVLGAPRVTEVRLAVNRLVRDEAGGWAASATGRTVDIDTGLVLRAVGYAGIDLPGLPFDERSGVTPNQDCRIGHSSADSAGLYVAGGAKRGPSGIIGTNRNAPGTLSWPFSRMPSAA